MNVYMNNKILLNDVVALCLLYTYLSASKVDITLMNYNNINTNHGCYINCGNENNPLAYKFNSYDEYYSNESLYKVGATGLTWKYFGKDILKIYLQYLDYNINDEYLQLLKDIIYIKILSQYDSNKNIKYDYIPIFELILNKCDGFDQDFHKILSYTETMIDINISLIIKDFYQSNKLFLYESKYNGLFYNDNLDSISQIEITKYLDMFDPFNKIKAIIMIKCKPMIFYMDNKCIVINNIEKGHEIYLNRDTNEKQYSYDNDSSSKLLCMFQNKLSYWPSL